MFSGMVEEEISERSTLKDSTNSQSQLAQTQMTFLNTMDEKESDKGVKEEGELDDDDSPLWQPLLTFLPDVAFSNCFFFSKNIFKNSFKVLD